MEESQQQIGNLPSYWNSVIIAGAIFGLISAIGQLVGGYVLINTGEQSNIINVGFCLIGAFAGFTALWHYNDLGDFSMSLGRGALIGFLAGAAAALLSMGFVWIWKLIDPSYEQAFKQANIAMIENDGSIPDEWKQISIDMIHDPSLMMTILTSIGGIVFMGVLNMLTGMLGVKVFGKKEEKF